MRPMNQGNLFLTRLSTFPMSMKLLLDHIADYDRWANTRFIERLTNESDVVLDRTVPSSFPSLRATVLHMRDAEAIWLARLNGTSGQWPAEPSDSIRTLIPHTERLREWVHGTEEARLNERVTYHDLRGHPHTQERWQMLLHCFNHSTQHRGQLITMMRALELDRIPANDLVAYQRSLIS